MSLRVRLEMEEKARIGSIVKVWRPVQVSQRAFDEIRKDFGVPRGLVQTMFWHVDTLDLLGKQDWLIFKGGTCVQSHLPHARQRASDDLDFNSKLANPNTIRAEVDVLNKKAMDEGRAVRLEGVDFGTLEPFFEDRKSGTLTYKRRMPSKFEDIETVGGVDIQSKAIKVQINYRHAWLPAIRPVIRKVDFFIMARQRPVHRVMARHSSVEDLVADKVVAASAANPSHREKFKDIYDLESLLTLTRYKKRLVMEKLEMVAREMGLKAPSLVKGAMQTISNASEKGHIARDHSSVVCRDGRNAIADWEAFCIRTMDGLDALMK